VTNVTENPAGAFCRECGGVIHDGDDVVTVGRSDFHAGCVEAPANEESDKSDQSGKARTLASALSFIPRRA
jgi:hypothetical protein